MHSLNSILGRIIKDYGLEGGIVLRAVLKQWDKLVGGAIASHTSPVEIKGKLLTVNVDSPQWLHNLGFYKQDMLDKLTSFNISDIRFRIGKVAPRDNDESEAQEQMLGDDDLRYIENTLKDVKDEELRKTFRKLIVHGLSKGRKD